MLVGRKLLRGIEALRKEQLNVLVFTGSEEKDLRESYETLLGPEVPVVFEPSVREFAAMLSRCGLFVTRDSGPIHLAYGLGVRTVAIFLHNNFNHWAPPSDLTRVVYLSGGCSPTDALTACREELAYRTSEQFTA